MAPTVDVERTPNAPTALVLLPASVLLDTPEIQLLNARTLTNVPNLTLAVLEPNAKTCRVRTPANVRKERYLIRIQKLNATR